MRSSHDLVKVVVPARLDVRVVVREVSHDEHERWVAVRDELLDGAHTRIARRVANVPLDVDGEALAGCGWSAEHVVRAVVDRIVIGRPGLEPGERRLPERTGRRERERA